MRVEGFNLSVVSVGSAKTKAVHKYSFYGGLYGSPDKGHEIDTDKD